MPDLDKDTPAALMHAVGDFSPARDLLFRIDAGRILIALALLRDLAGFGYQEPGRGALSVVFDRQRARHHAGRDGAVARQRRHHEAVRQRERAKLVGLEQFGRLAHVFLPGTMTDAGELILENWLWRTDLKELCIAADSAMPEPFG